MKRIVSILVLICVFSSLIATMFGCVEEEPVYTKYSVSVVDDVGNPIPQVIVKFVDSEGVSRTKITGKDGLAVIENVLAGDYTVYVEQGFSSAVITTGRYELTAEKTDLQLILRDSQKTVDIYGAIPENSYAYVVGATDYNIICREGGYTYLVFYAHNSGVYRFSIPSDSNATLGFYGIPLFVQADHCLDGEYDGKSFELTIQDTATPYVLGIKSDSQTAVLLDIERVSDAPVDPMHAPWTEIAAEQATFEKCDFTGKKLVDVDIADGDFEAILGNDGHYYTADGKPIYIRITTVTSYGRLDESLQFSPVVNGSLALMAGHVDQNIGVNIGGYIYDDAGNFVTKNRYNTMIGTYMSLADETYGVVPLTAELAECIKLHGEANGWWKETNPGYLFDGIVVDKDNSWLFLCMVEQ